MTQSYPLHWPHGWPRTTPGARRPAAFKTREHNGRFPVDRAITIAVANRRLQEQIDHLRVASCVLSTNVELRLDGQPRSDRRAPEDPGVALYFTLDGRDQVLACDKWDTVAANINAIAKHIEALRGIDRWGVGSLKQAFAGYVALPAAAEPDRSWRPWWDVLGICRTASRSEVQVRWREMMRAAHPDAGGTEARAAELNRARDEALAEIDRNA